MNEKKSDNKFRWLKLLIGPEGAIAAVGGLGLLITTYATNPDTPKAPYPTTLTECPGIHELIEAPDPFSELPIELRNEKNIWLASEYTKCVTRVNVKRQNTGDK